jgi:hypothetical protein
MDLQREEQTVIEMRRARETLNPWAFFALALGLSWLFWIPTALLEGQPTAFPLIILMILGGAGPGAGGGGRGDGCELDKGSGGLGRVVGVEGVWTCQRARSSLE